MGIIGSSIVYDARDVQSYARTAGTAWYKGQPVYLVDANTVALALSTDSTKDVVIGVLAEDVASADTVCSVVLRGKVWSADWTNAAGTTELTAGAVYYLDSTAGKITASVPILTFEKIRRIGIAITANELSVDPVLVEDAPQSYYEYFDDFISGNHILAYTGWVAHTSGVTMSRNQQSKSGGLHRIATVVDDAAQATQLTWDNVTQFYPGNELYFEARAVIRWNVFPANHVCYIGLCGSRNIDPDAIAESIWFKITPAGVLVVETDDGINEQNDVATGVTMAKNTYYLLGFRTRRVDASTLHVEFYVNNTRVAGSTTFNMSNALTKGMQPFWHLAKTSGTDNIDVAMDWIRIRGVREPNNY